jgi:hypothetical protein
MRWQLSIMGALLVVAQAGAHAQALRAAPALTVPSRGVQGTSPRAAVTYAAWEAEEHALLPEATWPLGTWTTDDPAATRRAALRGAIVGALVGWLPLALACHSPVWCGDADAPLPLVGAGLGGAAGALVGVLIERGYRERGRAIGGPAR